VNPASRLAQRIASTIKRRILKGSKRGRCGRGFRYGRR
jgi:hypothetical protein